MESSVDACTDKLVKSILESRAYRRFIRAQENLDKRPDLKEQINQYRTDIFKLYEEGADEDLIDTSDILEKKFQSMQKIPEVNAYLDAETEICRMVREIYQRLILYPSASSISMYIPSDGLCPNAILIACFASLTPSASLSA